MCWNSIVRCCVVLCLVYYMETAEYVGFSTDDDGGLGTHTLLLLLLLLLTYLAPLQKQLWGHFACVWSFSVMLVPGLHVGYFIPVVNCLRVNRSSEVSLLSSLLFILITTECCFPHLLHLKNSCCCLEICWDKHIAGDLFGVPSSHAAEVTLNLWTNNAFETKKAPNNIFDTCQLWKILLDLKFSSAFFYSSIDIFHLETFI